MQKQSINNQPEILEESPQKRAHRLIGLGGLMQIAGLHELDRPMAMGLLIEVMEQYQSMSEEKRGRLFNLGFERLKSRSKRKEELEDIKPKKGSQRPKFYYKEGFENWMDL